MEHDTRSVFFFDIDNCLYPRSKKVHELMQNLIDKYFKTHLSLKPEEAGKLHETYYKQYGLAIEGLVRHHKIDALEYNRKVDDALPLENVIFQDPALRNLLENLDTTKVKPWLFTNAYITHGKRVVALLGVEDLFEGITYADYSAPGRGEKMICKPTKEAYAKAMSDAGIQETSKCFFVDDSYMNCREAQALGWTAIHLIDPSDCDPPVKASAYQIRNLNELCQILPEFFKTPKA